MGKEYSKEDFQRELERKGPKDIKGFLKLNLESYDINPNSQSLRDATNVIPKILQEKVWDLAHGQIKYGVDSENSNFGIVILPTLFGRRPNEREIEQDSYSFGNDQAKNGPNRVVEAVYKLFGFEKEKDDLSLQEIKKALSLIDYKGPTENVAELSIGISFINSQKKLERLLIQPKDTELGKFHLDGSIKKFDGEYGVLYGPNDFESIQRYLLD